MPSKNALEAIEDAAPTEWLRYSNSGATRNQPVSEQLRDALSFLPELGVTAEVFSGGQPSAGQGARVGSDRHDHGNAADVFFYKDGERLNWANPEHLPIYEAIVQRGKSAGITGFGAGEGYMSPGSMHIGFGAPAVWGAGGRGSNAPDWLRMAYAGGSAPIMRASAKPPGKPNFLQAALGGIRGGIGGFAQQAQPTVMRAAQRAAPSIMQAALGSIAGRSAIIDPMIQKVFSNGSIMTPAKLASAQRAVSQSGDTSVGNQAEAAATRASAQSYRDSRR